MLNILSPVFVSVLALLSASAEASPARNKASGTKGKAQTLQAQAAAIPQGISEATDGSTILDTNATVKYGCLPPPPRVMAAGLHTLTLVRRSGLTLRYKISAPADQFTTASGVTGGTQEAGAQGAMGINVLLHGDGGQSFFDFPNQAVQQNLMGVVILAPSGTCRPL